MIDAVNDFNAWLVAHPEYYEPYWFWVSSLAALATVLWAIDVSSRAKDRRMEMRPIAVQAQAHLFAALVCIIALSFSAFVGYRLVEDIEGRGRYVILMLLTLITSFALLVGILWSSHRLAVWRAQKLLNDERKA